MKNEIGAAAMNVNIHQSIMALKRRYTELEQYAYIMKEVHTTNVSTDSNFQRGFNYFYKIRRNADWRKAFYDLFEECKTVENLTFEYILRTLYAKTGNIEASFSSKLLATLEPDMPIWDSIVLQNLSLRPNNSQNQDKRLDGTVKTYQDLVCWYQEFLQTARGHEFVAAFDTAFPDLTGIGAVKKVDFLIWGKGKWFNLERHNTEENKYLLYSHYGVKESFDGAEIIMSAARKSLLDFCRRVPFYESVKVKGRFVLDREAQEMFSKEIPALLEATDFSLDPQTTFDIKHHEICEEIIRIYSSAGSVTYGIAQRWLNLTLMNLAVIESHMDTEFWPLDTARKYYHVPVEQYVLEAAARRTPNRYQHSLGLKCAPLRHDDPDSYEMDWYVLGDTQPFEYWGYSEYVEFQLAVREALKEPISAHAYQDVLDWSFKAFLEVAQFKVK